MRHVSHSSGREAELGIDPNMVHGTQPGKAQKKKIGFFRSLVCHSGLKGIAGSPFSSTESLPKDAAPLTPTGRGDDPFTPLDPNFQAGNFEGHAQVKGYYDGAGKEQLPPSPREGAWVNPGGGCSPDRDLHLEDAQDGCHVARADLVAKDLAPGEDHLDHSSDQIYNSSEIPQAQDIKSGEGEGQVMFPSGEIPPQPTYDSTPYNSSEYDVRGGGQEDSMAYSSSEMSPYRMPLGGAAYGKGMGDLLGGGVRRPLMFGTQDMRSSQYGASMMSSGEFGMPADGTRENEDGIELGMEHGGVSQATVKSLVNSLHSSHTEERLNAAVSIRKITKTDNTARRMMAEGGALVKLVEMLHEQRSPVVEAAVYAILVLAINEEVRWNINGALVIPLLLRLTSHPLFSVQEGSTALLFCLSGIDENKILIGNMGGIPVLMDLLAHGSGRMKRDVLRTLYNLSLLSINKTTLLQHRVVSSIVRLVSSAPAHKLSEIAVSLLRNLATRDEGRDAIVAHQGVNVLAKVLECGSALGKEEAVSVLLVLSTRNSSHREVVKAARLLPSVRSLAVSGTPRARARAEELIHDLSEPGKEHGR